jgi:hypothetical protein
MNRWHGLAIQVVAMLLISTGATGCASWHSIGKETPAAYVAHEKPDVVRFSVGDSSLVLSRPAVQGDSVIGLCKERPPTPVDRRS